MKTLLFVLIPLIAFFVLLMVVRQPDQVDRYAIVELGGVRIRAEIADEPDEWERGLAGRPSLAPDSGMLFVFPQPGHYSFWMKGMRFPLDILWLDRYGVVDLAAQVLSPEPGTLDSALTLHAPRLAASFVLEVPAGFIRANQIRLGDRARVELP